MTVRRTSYYVSVLHARVAFTLAMIAITFLVAACSSAPQTTTETIPVKKDTVEIIPVEEINGKRILRSVPGVTHWTGYIQTTEGEHLPLNISINGGSTATSTSSVMAGNWYLTRYGDATPTKSTGTLHWMFDSTSKRNLLLTFRSTQGDLPAFTARTLVKESIRTDLQDLSYLPPGHFVIESDTTLGAVSHTGFRKLFVMNSNEIIP